MLANIYLATIVVSFLLTIYSLHLESKILGLEPYEATMWDAFKIALVIAVPVVNILFSWHLIQYIMKVKKLLKKDD